MLIRRAIVMNERNQWDVVVLNDATFVGESRKLSQQPEFRSVNS